MDLKLLPLTQFLQEELQIPSDSIPEILAQCNNLNRLCIVLWQQKLVSFSQIDRVFSFVEKHQKYTKLDEI